MDSREKRPHTVTGNTPNKPSEKRHRELEVEPKRYSYVLKTSNDKAISNTATGAIFIYSEDTLTMNTEAFCIIFTVIYLFSQT